MSLTGTYVDKTMTDVQRLAFLRLAQAFGTRSGATQALASSDVAQGLPTSVTQDGAFYTGMQRIQRDQTGQEDPTGTFKTVPVLASSALITVENASIRYAFGGVAPTQGANPVGHLLEAGQSLKLDNPADVASFQFISAVAATPAVLQVTAGF